MAAFVLECTNYYDLYPGNEKYCFPSLVGIIVVQTIFYYHVLTNPNGCAIAAICHRNNLTALTCSHDSDPAAKIIQTHMRQRSLRSGCFFFYFASERELYLLIRRVTIIVDKINYARRRTTQPNRGMHFLLAR